MTGTRWTRRTLLAVGATAVTSATASLAGCLGTDDESGQWDQDGTLAVASAKQFNAPDCGCCEEYATYLQEHVEGDLEVTTPDDIGEIKREYGVPADLESCHTLEIDGYVVEGHVPVEVLEQLLEEEPEIDGIALPGMPSGSPGMPGPIEEPFTVYAIDDGAYDVYTEV